MGINVVSSYANTYTYGNVKDESTLMIILRLWIVFFLLSVSI